MSILDLINARLNDNRPPVLASEVRRGDRISIGGETVTVTKVGPSADGRIRIVGTLGDTRDHLDIVSLRIRAEATIRRTP